MPTRARSLALTLLVFTASGTAFAQTAPGTPAPTKRPTLLVEMFAVTGKDPQWSGASCSAPAPDVAAPLSGEDAAFAARVAGTTLSRIAQPDRPSFTGGFRAADRLYYAAFASAFLPSGNVAAQLDAQEYGNDFRDRAHATTPVAPWTLNASSDVEPPKERKHPAPRYPANIDASTRGDREGDPPLRAT